MISNAESGLTLSQYNALKAQFTDYVFKVIAKRYNLDFGTSAWFTSGTVTDGTTHDFDAVIMGGYLFRVSGSTMERIDLSTGSVTVLSGFAAPSGYTAGSGYSLVVDGSTLYAFAATSTGVSRNSTSDNGATWAGWTAIYTVSSQTFYSGNVCRGGAGSASSEYVIGELSYPGSNAFDGVEGDQWQTAVGVTAATLTYTFADGVERIVKKYTIFAPGTAAPKDWTFQGYNGSTWTTLDTRSGITGWAVAGEAKTYTFSNSTAYQAYRLNISDENGFGQIFVNELTMFEEVAEQSVQLVAATSPTRCHLVYADAATRTYNLRVMNYSGSWAVTSSGITLTDRVLSMDAVTDDEQDYIVLESEIPGTVTTYLDVTALKFKRPKSKALLCFRYKISNPVWTPHTAIDTISELEAYADVKNVKVERINGTLFVTAYRSSGTEDNPVTGYRVYTSKDGMHWSSPRLFALGVAQSYGGAKWVPSGDYLYAVERHVVWRSYSTDFVGGTPSAISADITAYVDSLGIDKGDMARVAMELSNATGWLDAHSFINKDNLVKVEVYLGGTDSTGVDRLYLDTTGYIDTFSVDDAVSGQNVRFMVQVSARDATSWMTDDTIAEDFRAFEGYRVGADSFVTEEATDYGGLAHWWPLYGDWKTDGGYLYAAVKQNEYNYAIGRSTLFDQLWNGAVQTHMIFSTCDAFAGVTFRGKSVNNLFCHWFWGYDRPTDKLYFQYRVGKPLDPDRSYTIWTSSTKSWTTDIQGAGKHLRAEFYYGKMYLYSSADGVTWTLETTQTLDCALKQVAGLTNYDETVQLYDRIEAGYVGLEAQVVNASVVGGVGGVRFEHVKITDYEQVMTLERAYKMFAAFANIHDWTFDDTYTGSSNGWTLGSGVTLEASGSGSAVYGEAIYGVSTYG